MNAQEYILNIRPGVGYAPTVKISQYDIGRPLQFHLYDGTAPLAIATGTTIKIHATKPSGLGFEEACTWSGSSASIDTTESMTQEYGIFPAELELSVGGDIIGTANFMMHIERSPHPDGTTDGTKEELDDLYTEVANLKSELDEIKDGGMGVSDDLKAALLQLAANVGYKDGDGSEYYQDLYDALYPPIPATAIILDHGTLSFSSVNQTQQLTATLTPATSTDTVSWSSSDTSVATVSSSGLVTSKGTGTATITATAHTGLSATCVVSVEVATLSSISAVYTQSGAVYPTTSLDDLKADLVVTATWSDSSTSTVSADDYTLSGTLAVGTSTVTVTYGGETDTFSVTVSNAPAMPIYNWDFKTSMTDTVQSAVATTTATRTDNVGITFSAGNKYTDYGAVFARNRTYELDVASQEANSGNVHKRLIAFDTDANTGQGGAALVFRASTSIGWTFYTGSAWDGTKLSTGSDTQTIFNGKTVKLYLDSDGYATVSSKTIGADDSTYVELGKSTSPLSNFTNGHVYNGGNNNDTLLTTTISGFRIYEGEK